LKKFKRLLIETLILILFKKKSSRRRTLETISEEQTKEKLCGRKSARTTNEIYAIITKNQLS